MGRMVARTPHFAPMARATYSDAKKPRRVRERGLSIAFGCWRQSQGSGRWRSAICSRRQARSMLRTRLAVMPVVSATSLYGMPWPSRSSTRRARALFIMSAPTGMYGCVPPSSCARPRVCATARLASDEAGTADAPGAEISVTNRLVAKLRHTSGQSGVISASSGASCSCVSWLKSMRSNISTMLTSTLLPGLERLNQGVELGAGAKAQRAHMHGALHPGVERGAAWVVQHTIAGQLVPQRPHLPLARAGRFLDLVELLARQRAAARGGLGNAHALGQALQVVAHMGLLGGRHALAAGLAGELDQQRTVVVVLQLQLGLEDVDGGGVIVSRHGCIP